MLKSLRLKNFKAFDEIEIEFSSLTLLSGLNGSGKSTILQALGLLRQSYDARFLREGQLGLNAELVELGTGRDLLYQNFDTQEILIALRDIKDDEGEECIWCASGGKGDDVLQCVNSPVLEKMELLGLFSNGFQFLRADRITPSVTFPKSQNAVRQQRFLGARGEFTAHFLFEFGEVLTTNSVVRHIEETEATSLLAQVNAWMQEFSPGVRVEPQPVPMTDLVRLVFSYKGEGAAYGEPLRPTNVGFGLTHALPVITACLAAQPGTLLIVENPEAQLHPRGQSTIGRLLALTAATGVQVIVETHSDHVLNGIRLAVKEGLLPPADTRLHFFSRAPGQASSYESPMMGDDGRLSYWPPNFFDQWERNLDQLLE